MQVGTFHPFIGHEGPQGEQSYSSTLFQTSVLEGGEGSASRPGRTLPLAKTRYTLYKRLGGPQGRSGQLRKISPHTGIRSPDRPALETIYFHQFRIDEDKLVIPDYYYYVLSPVCTVFTIMYLKKTTFIILQLNKKVLGSVFFCFNFGSSFEGKNVCIRRVFLHFFIQ